jgi:hypothetical protein
MIFAQRNTVTGDWKRAQYPAKDYRPIQKLVGNIKYYAIVENERPDYNRSTHKLVKSEVFNDEAWENKPHIGILNITYTTERLTDDQINENLNNSVGQHLDSLYPEWERSKHAGESLRYMLKGQENWTPEDLDRINYIQSTADWCRSCRELRDQKETELRTNGTLPAFEWPERPPK